MRVWLAPRENIPTYGEQGFTPLRALAVMLARNATNSLTLIRRTLAANIILNKEDVFLVFTTRTLVTDAAAGGRSQILMIATIHHRTDQWPVSYRAVGLGRDAAY